MSEDKEKRAKELEEFLVLEIGRASVRALRHFFVPLKEDFEGKFQPILENTSPQFTSLAESFKRNLLALTSTASMPFMIASTNRTDRMFHQILMSEKILALKPEFKEKTEDERDEMALRIAREKFREVMKSEEHQKHRAQAILADLEHLLGSPEMTVAAAELVRQSDVMAWGILEVLANDLFIGLLNANPKLTEILLQDERTKKRFQLRDVVLPLSTYSYDLSQHMGDVLSSLVKIDDVETMRTVYDVILPDKKTLHALLRKGDLWKLNQRRNLILHRRSIVDSLYLKNTGDKLSVGEELIISPAQFDYDLSLVFETGSEMLKSLIPENSSAQN